MLAIFTTFIMGCENNLETSLIQESLIVGQWHQAGGFLWEFTNTGEITRGTFNETSGFILTDEGNYRLSGETLNAELTEVRSQINWEMVWTIIEINQKYLIVEEKGYRLTFESHGELL